MPSVYIETFGCQMNEADSQFIADRAAAAGYAIADEPQAANVVILNTCTVRDNAERRAYGRMGHFKLLKESDPSTRVVVMGCLAEQDRDRMQQLAPHVDAIFGTKELVALADQLAQWGSQFEPAVSSIEDEERALILPMGGKADAIADAFSHLRAFVNVQRGCSYYCTFCIVPHVRGRFDHRPLGEIVAEVEAKIAAGAREVMLVGQTVNAWKDPVSGDDFGDLCRTVAALPGLERLTFISPHPKDFTSKIIRDLGSIEALNPRVHLPLQSGSDALLRRMNRKYTMEQFRSVVAQLREHLPNVAITTDIIVGFPGETEEDFQATLDYVRTGVFANAFAFIYSPRRGTPAAQWEQVPHEIASERFTRLFDAQNEVVRAYHDRKIGSTVRALVTGPSKKDAAKLAAKAIDNVTVIAPNPPDFDEALYAREPWIDVRVESAHVWGVMGTIVRRATHYADAATPVEAPLLSLL
jgi:tRNA-2-methylthio-N6-dimethylallyladenosine synthase